MKHFIIKYWNLSNNQKSELQVQAVSENEAQLDFNMKYKNLVVLSINEVDISIIRELLDEMDDMFGHDLTNVIVNGGVINSGVGLAFSHPKLKSIDFFKKPITILLQAGFSHEYRKKQWSHILQDTVATNIISHFSGLDRKNMPLVKAALADSVGHINDELRRYQTQ